MRSPSFVASIALVWLSLPAVPGDWPQSRSPQRDVISSETNLPQSGRLEGPPLLWKPDLSDGYGAFRKHGAFASSGFPNRRDSRARARSYPVIAGFYIRNPGTLLEL
jgi:hypothetical protein